MNGNNNNNTTTTTTTIMDIFDESQYPEEEIQQKALEFCIKRDHLWCKHHTVIRLLLADICQDQYKQLRELLSEQLSRCLDCIIKYHREKKLLRDKYLSEFTTESVDELYLELKKCDQNRLLSSLEYYSHDTTRLVNIFHELLHQPEILENKKLFSLFKEKLASTVTDYDVSFGDPGKKVPGVYVLLMSGDKVLVEWAVNHLKENDGRINGEEFHVIHPIFERCISKIKYHHKQIQKQQLQQQQQQQQKMTTPTANTTTGEFISYFSDDINHFWYGFEILLEYIDVDTLKNGITQFFPMFIDIILSEIDITPMALINHHYLSCINQLLGVFGNDIWTNKYDSISYCQSLFNLFTLYRDEVTLNKCFQIFSRLLELVKEESSTEFNTLRQTLIEFFLKESDLNNTKQQQLLFNKPLISNMIKVKSFSVSLDILITCYQLKQYPVIRGWEDRLIYYATSQPSSTPNNIYKNNNSYSSSKNIYSPSLDDIIKAENLLNIILLSTATELRLRFQLVYHSSNDTKLKILKDHCSFWCDDVWKILLTQSLPNNIGYKIHETLFKCHRILCLLTRGNDIVNNNVNLSSVLSNLANRPPALYRCLDQYQEYMGQYFIQFSNQYPFNTPKEPGNEYIKLNLLDQENFARCLFSLVVSSSEVVRDGAKKLLLKKYNNKKTITEALKAAIEKSPNDALLGIIGTFRDIVFNFGAQYIQNSFHLLFYYSNHIFYQLKNQLAPSHTQTYFPLMTDAFWSIIELFLQQNQLFSTEQLTNLFILFTDSFTTLSLEHYTSIFKSSSLSTTNDSTMPAFIINHRSLLFPTIDSYPPYIRPHLGRLFIEQQNNEDHTTNAQENNSRFNYNYQLHSGQLATISNYPTLDTLFNHYEEMVDDIKCYYRQNDYDDDSSKIYTSIINNHSHWIDLFMGWGDENVNWAKSLIQIIKSILKNEIKPCFNLLNETSKILKNITTKKLQEDVKQTLEKHLNSLNQHNQTNQKQPPSSTTTSPYTSTYNNNNNNNNNNKNVQPIKSIGPSTPTLNFGGSSPFPKNNFNSKESQIPNLFSELSSNNSSVFDYFEQTSKTIPLADRKKTKIIDVGGSFKSSKDKGGKLSHQMEQFLPKVENLHKKILSWDPSNLNENDTDGLRSIPTTFENLTEYITIFEPLLLQEYKGQLIKCMEEMDNVCYKLTVEDVARENDFHICDYFLDHSQNADDLLIDDLVIISKPQFGGSKFGKIEKKERKERKELNNMKCSWVKVRLYFDSDKQKQQNISQNPSSLANQLKIGSQWKMTKVTSLSTVNREYMALHTVGRIPLGASIISPSLSLSSYSSENSSTPANIPKKLENALKETLNQSQIDAIHASLSPSGFTLLQGPPGTGKTKTIIALLSVLLHTMPTVKDYSKLKNQAPIKILVTAPSNAAVDEIATRILDLKMLNQDGQPYQPFCIRIGNRQQINPYVSKISIDNLLSQELSKDDNKVSQIENKVKTLHEESEKTKAELDEIHNRISQLNQELKSLREGKQPTDHITNELTKLYNKKSILNSSRTNFIEIRKGYDSLENERKLMLSNLLNKASIVLSTLSGSGYESLSAAIKQFDVVIVDEAAQAVELSTLIPLKHNVKKCILVGDPNQLPATIISRITTHFQYEQSLFQRLAACGIPIQILNVQYRMHPTISQFPSKHFYAGQIKDGDNVKALKHNIYRDSRFGPFIFYDIVDSVEESSQSSHSLRNIHEAKLANLIISQLVAQFPKECEKLSIGVITPYKQQQIELSRRLSHYNNIVEVNTVDGFQGREKDIIIFSCVRAHKGGSIGFLSDVRRMNVGLTRAKLSMIVIGHTNLLMLNSDWGELIKFSQNLSNGYFAISSRSIDDNDLPMVPHPSKTPFHNHNDKIKKHYLDDEENQNGRASSGPIKKQKQ